MAMKSQGTPGRKRRRAQAQSARGPERGLPKVAGARVVSAAKPGPRRPDPAGERRREQQALRTARIERRALFETAPVGIAILRQGVVLKCNARLEEMAGYGQGELLGKPIWIGYADKREWRRVAPEVDAKIRSGGIVHFEVEARKKNGRRFWAMVDGRSLDTKRPGDTAIFVITDITEHRRALERLRESEERFRSLTALSSDWYWEQDEQFRFTAESKSAEATVGTPFSERRGHTPWGLSNVGVSDEAWAAHRALLEAHKPFRDFELGRPRPDGRIAWVSVSGEPILDERGNFLGYRGATRDITARKEAEANVQSLNAELERRIAELELANREMESFTYSVSHDLRAPLRALDGFARLLVTEYDKALDDDARGYLGRISANAARMGQLIDDLLDLSRTMRTRMDRRDVDLSRVVVELAAELRESDRGRQVELVIAPQARAEGDPRLLRIVLQNLLDNAWKFTQKHARARIEFGVQRDAKGRRVFFLRDDGAGFDMAYGDKLFGPFQRLHRVDEFPGTGIGLATVQRIVHRHGGTVWAEGEVGKGATFYFTLEEGPMKGNASSMRRIEPPSCS